jgi:5-methylcytosine-specific restriction enzyme subunit McrC
MKQVQLSDIPKDKETGKRILKLKEYSPTTEFLIGQKEFNENEEKLVEFLNSKLIEIHSSLKGIVMSTKQFVGSAEFRDFIIEINPKFTNIKNLPLLIDYAHQISDKDFIDTELKFESSKNYPAEILISILTSQCQKLIRLGLSKSYVIVDENLPYLRGRLMLAQQIQNDAKINLKFACEYDELSSNTLENQIILYVLKKAYHITQNDFVKQKIHKLIHEFDMEVNDKVIQKSDFNNIHYDRYNSHYEKIHFVCKLIFEQLGISDIYKHDTSFIFPIFINMNTLFEKYVTRLFEDFTTDQITIKSQPDTATDAWETDAIVDSKDKGIEPDLIIESESDSEKYPIIADVKYMTSKNVGSSQLYQIAFYLNDYKKNKAYALIPEYEESKEHSWKAIKQDVTINLVKIPIDDFLEKIYFEEENIQYIKDILNQKIPIFD